MHHRLGALLALVLILASGLAGCLSDDDDGNGQVPPGNGNGNDDPVAKGRISGVVEDDRGVALAGVQVELSRLFLKETTGDDGAFAFDNILPGSYRLTFTKDHYRRHTESVNLGEGGGERVNVNLQPIMLAPGVPAAHGKVVDYVAVLDILLVGVGIPGLPRQTLTNETVENTFPGFWEIEPEPGYLLAQLSVTVFWVNLDPQVPPQGLGVHYFRGESPLENELIESVMVGYHEPEPVLEGEIWRMYQIENDDWQTWGHRTWQVGVNVLEPAEVSPLGAAILHTVMVRGILVDEDYAATL